MSRGKKKGGTLGKVQGEGALLDGFRSEGADLKELRVSFNCGRGFEKRRGKDGRSGVKDVGERGSDWYRSRVQPGSGEGGRRTGEGLWGFAFGA